jgi:ABC-type Zn uptake system ZnuABC Zn-binding protein ZnuA
MTPSIRSCILALAIVLGGCTTADSPGGEPALSVVASTTQVGSIVDEIGGDDVALTVLLKPGVEAHDFELTPAAGAAIEGADLILKSGAGLEPWLDEVIQTIGGNDRVRDLSEGIELRMTDGEVDPHYWMAAPSAIRMVENARDALAEAAPEVAGAITDRAGVLIGRLEEADAVIRGLIDEIPEDRRLIVTDHDALGYFIDAYGLTFGGSVFPSLDVTAQPSARDIEELVATIREHDIPAIFSESAVNPALSEAVAAETDARLVDDPLYTDALGPPGSGADTLDGMILHNAQVIHDALVGA